MKRVILSPTKEVQARINKEAKKEAAKVKREEASKLKKEVYANMDEALRGLNASAKYLSSPQGIEFISKIVPNFNGKVSKGQLFTVFSELDNAKMHNDMIKKIAAKNPSKLIIELLKQFISGENSLSDDDKESLNFFLKDIEPTKNLILVLNNGDRRNQFTNAQLIKAAQYISEVKKVESLG